MITIEFDTNILLAGLVETFDTADEAYYFVTSNKLENHIVRMSAVGQQSIEEMFDLNTYFRSKHEQLG